MSPGLSPAAVMVPMRVRRSRATGCAIASHIRRTCRLRPSRRTSSITDCGVFPGTTRSSRTRAGSVRRPSTAIAATQAIEIALVGHALDQRLVGALELVARMRDALGELAVVGEDDQPFGVVVEPADRIEVAADTGRATRSITVRRRCGSDRVLTTPRGLFSRRWRLTGCALRRRPSTRMSSCPDRPSCRARSRPGR